MGKDKLYIFFLFIVSIYCSFASNRIPFQKDVFLIAFVIYWLFTLLSFHLRTISKTGSITIDYGINYSLSFVLIFGPFGLLIYESLFRLSAYLYKKLTKTADPDEFIHVFYNIGSFVLQNTITFYVFQHLNKTFSTIPFGFWLLMILLTIINAALSDIFLMIIFYIIKEIHTKEDLVEFVKSRSLVDLLKISFVNGMLFNLFIHGQWEMLLGLFIINYLVSHSFYSKAIFVQNKLERDQFEKMAFTDFLTGVHNRAFMDKKMSELNYTSEEIGIVVGDIDHFKKINDTFNHSVGDQVIKHFAAALKKYLSQDDFLFRSGGEEFTMFLRNKNYEEIKHLLEKILLDIENSTLNLEYNNLMVQINYTASLGLFYYKDGNISMEKGYILADQLMFESKKSGRNQLTSQVYL
jgi:diguanylate cyclase (GGDEF)-like protein